MSMSTLADSPFLALLSQVAYHIGQPASFAQLLTTIAQTIQTVVACDRVVIYEFCEDGSGKVAAAAGSTAQPTELVDFYCCTQNDSTTVQWQFHPAQIHWIEDRATGQGKSCRRHADSGQLDFAHAQAYPLTATFLTSLEVGQVQSAYALPLLPQSTSPPAWGFLALYHTSVLALTSIDLQILQATTDQLSHAIEKHLVAAQLQEKFRQEAWSNRITALLHSLSVSKFQGALQETLKAMKASGGRLYLLSSPPASEHSTPVDRPETTGQLLTHGTPLLLPPGTHHPHPLLELFYADQAHFRQNLSPWAIADLYADAAWQAFYPVFRTTAIRSILVIPLYYRTQILGYLTLFRDAIAVPSSNQARLKAITQTAIPTLEEVNTTGLSGATRHASDSSSEIVLKQILEQHRQFRQERLQPWTEDDLDLAQTLGVHFSTTIHHYRLHQHLQNLNHSLEQQVQDRTAKLQSIATELQYSEQQQQLLFQVVTKMRQSLHLKDIFATVTQEVRQFLHADRVGIYRLDAKTTQGTGQFIAEAVDPHFPSALLIKMSDHCFGEVYGDLYQQGRIHAIANVQTAGLQPCYLETLDRFQIKANLVAPILKHGHLWGLFCIHQCREPRTWQSADLQFITQVATQLGVALEQAYLLAHSRKQTGKLTKTLRELQATQAQLIQTEKMSSLGQLVAGVAHEINNPVNFIHGNLSYLNQTTAEVLQLVQMLQQHRHQLGDAVQAQLDTLDIDFLAEDLPKTVQSMKLGTERIRQIVQSLRTFSRLDEADRKSIDLQESIDSTLLILQHRLNHLENTEKFQILKEYADLPKVECYGGLLNQVIMNLVVNAIDALEAQSTYAPLYHQTAGIENPIIDRPTILIQTQQPSADWVTIAITDNGIGMSPEVQKKLFNPFFTTKPVGKGTGLGLSISYKIIVEQHGGKLTCRSAPGQGTTLTIAIPS